MENREVHHICMIVQDPAVHGGIAAVTSGYYGSRLENDFRITYVESYCDGSRGRKLRKALSAYRKFRKILREDPPELVHIHASFGPSFYREIPFIEMASRKGIPVINHVHGSAFDEFYENASERKKALVRKEYGKCARIIVLSDHWKDVFSSVISAERIVVIPNYSVLHPEVMADRQMQKRFQTKQVLYLGVITEGKGMREMPEIIRKTAAKVPGVRFVLGGVGDTNLVTKPLAGDRIRIYEKCHEAPHENEAKFPAATSGKMEDEIKICKETRGTGERSEGISADKAAGLQGSLYMPGWVRGQEKEKLLKESMVFLLPSHMEAMPMSILEAMGYGLPVVSTNVGGIPNLVKSGETGVLCNVGDVQAMADALIRYLTDEALWKETSGRTMRRADEAFGFERHLDQVEAVYREMLEPGKI